MSLYIRVVDGLVESVGSLPVLARRLDTGEVVDPRNWLRACGYADVETATRADLPPGLTDMQIAAIEDAVITARQGLERRRELAANAKQVLGLFKDVGMGHLEMDPAYPDRTPASHTTPPPTPGQVSQSLIYLYGRHQQVAYLMSGGGNDLEPGLTDIIRVLVDVVLELLEQADGIELPPA